MVREAILGFSGNANRALSSAGLALLLALLLGQTRPTTTSAPARDPNGLFDVGPARDPIPSPADLKPATALINDLFKAELAAARTPADKKALTQKLLQTAREEKGVSRYALLLKAHDQALGAGDVPDTVAALDALAAAFEVDVLKLKATAFAVLQRQVPMNAREHLAEEVSRAVQAALAADRLDVARTLVETLQSNAQTARGSELTATASALMRTLRDREAVYPEVKRAQQLLAEKPADPAANLKVGRYLCFLKADWDAGLPRLAAGGDAALKQLAERELLPEAPAEERVKLADGWWDTAAKEQGSAQQHIRDRAVKWYTDALPSLSGLSKQRVQQRIDQAARMDPGGRVKATVFLADMKEISADVGYGKFGKKGAMGYDGDAKAKVQKQIITQGLSAHAPSRLKYDLAKRFRTLTGAAGILDGTNSSSPLVFKIMGDGKQLWQSSPLAQNGKWQKFQVEIHNVSTLELVVECRGGNGYAHSIWIDPRVE